jgi:hypothetical protein
VKLKKSHNLKFGRYPNDPSRARVVLHPDGAVTPPASANWVGTSFPVSELGMLGNDDWGDCVFAGGYHAVDVFEFDGQAVTTAFTAAQALADYSTVTGFNPKNPSTDQGATLQEGLEFWQKTGFGGYKIDAFAQISNANLALVQACIAFFGVVYAGLNVPSSAMTQFNAGQPWSVVARSQIEGGHCVPLIGYDASSFTCITWAKTQQMTTQFYQRYFDETWVPISTDWMRKSGTTPSGLDTATANAQFQSLTGSTASPFPTVTPPTPPVPTPPAPSTDADTTLAAAARAWLTAKNL